MNILEWIVLVGAAFSALIYIFNKFFKLFKTWFKFIEDWNGTEDNPGVVERLKEGNERFDKIEQEITTIKHELFTNNGSSLRDAVNRIEHNTAKKSVRKTEHN